jgi:hypothetical protein
MGWKKKVCLIRMVVVFSFCWLPVVTVTAAPASVGAVSFAPSLSYLDLAVTSSGNGNVSIFQNDTCTPAPSGLVSWWRAEGDARDFWDGNHGAMQNGATFAAGKVGQAFFFGRRR